MSLRYLALHRLVIVLLVCAVVPSGGCRKTKTKTVKETSSQNSPAVKESSRPAAPKAATVEQPATPGKPATQSDDIKREVFTAANNPTTTGGRGAPDLEKPQSPSAWVYIDGRSGKYKEENGQQLLQWFIDDAARSTPTFRVEAYEPLLGVPRDFKAILRTVEAQDGSDLMYGIAAKDGTFQIGREYNLLNPGENFVIRNGMNGDEVKEIAPLPAGKYAIAAGVTNSESGKQTLAVTYFTVKSDE